MKGRIKFVPAKVFSAFYADSCFVILLFKICLMKFRFIEWVSILEVMHVLTTSILIIFLLGGLCPDCSFIWHFSDPSLRWDLRSELVAWAPGLIDPAPRRNAGSAQTLKKCVKNPFFQFKPKTVFQFFACFGGFSVWHFLRDDVLFLSSANPLVLPDAYAILIQSNTIFFWAVQKPLRLFYFIFLAGTGSQ